MSEQGSDSDRSENATPYRLAQARRKGTVARGMDLGFLVGLAAFTGYMWMLGGGVVVQIEQAARDALVVAPVLVASPNEVIAVTGAVLSSVFKPLAFMAGAIFLAVLTFEVVQTGAVFTTEPLKLDFSKLNPANGLKRIFTMRMLIETLKNLIKMTVYTVLGWLAVKGALEVSTPTITDARSLKDALTHDAFRLLSMFLGAALVFAAIDQLIARRDFAKRMKMSRRDVKRESRDREGDPRMKQRRKQLHREFVKVSESLRNIRGADVLITNPTHFAVALRYDRSKMDAPVIVSKGAHHMAHRLRRLAFFYGVVIVANPPLARALYRCELNRPVPEALFHPVADIYRAIRVRRRIATGELASA